LRDARAGCEPSEDAIEERERHLAAAQARRAHLQPLIDER
jgi:hypothetical protein